MIYDEYNRHGYEQGFAHGCDPTIEPPCKSQCDRFYWLGFTIARNA